MRKNRLGPNVKNNSILYCRIHAKELKQDAVGDGKLRHRCRHLANWRKHTHCLYFLLIRSITWSKPHLRSVLLSWSSRKRSGMARANTGSRSVLPATHTFIHEWNEPYLLYLQAAELRSPLAGTHFAVRWVGLGHPCGGLGSKSRPWSRTFNAVTTRLPSHTIFDTRNCKKILNLVNLPPSPVSCSHFALGNPKVIFNRTTNTYFWQYTTCYTDRSDCELVPN